MRRRRLLATLGVTAFGGGCLDSLQSTDATGQNSTTAATDGTATDAPGTRTGEPCEVSEGVTAPDVDVPDEVTADAAREVATFLEEAIARKRAEAEGWNVSGIESTNATVSEAETGLSVKATVRLDAVESAERADGTGTTLVASLYYAGWYHVTTTRIRRAPGRDADAPPENGWRTVACA